MPHPRPLTLATLSLLAAACSSTDPAVAPEVLTVAPNESIVACGERLFVGAPVVLWDDAMGYSAYETDLHFDAPPATTKTPPKGELRYKPGRTINDKIVVAPEVGELVALQRSLDMFVLHYDVCGVSETCFKVLHDRRGLSVHFMIDVDGTIYQTLDLRDTAWHARQTNSRSVGVEIANMGSYELDDARGQRTLDDWYDEDASGAYLTIPGGASARGVMTPGYAGRPARPGPITGEIQGSLRQQYDFTPEQYDSLVKLTATLCRHFPEIQPDAPRDAAGRVLDARMSEQYESEFKGIVGHYHVSSQKQDPGPAFDWDRYLAKVQTRLLRM